MVKSTKALTLDVVNARLLTNSRGITLTGEFKGASRKADFTCLNGHTWNTRVSSVLSGGGCPRCSVKHELSEAEVTLRLKPRGISVYSSFKNASVKAEFICAAGHRWLALPDNVIRGRGCPHCSKLARYTTRTLNDKLASRGIRLAGEMSGSHKDNFVCAKGHEWSATKGSVVSGRGCPRCADYGYSPGKPAHLYVVRMYNSVEAVVGYGITRNLVDRLNKHGKAMRDNGFKSQFAHSVYFEDGADALRLENILKQRLPRVKCTVPGFITECTSDEYYGQLFELIRGFRETIGSC